jgi:hypothetical protein
MSYRRPYATYSPYSAEVEAEAAKYGMAERATEVDADAEVHESGEGQMATDKFYSSYKSVFPFPYLLCLFDTLSSLTTPIHDTYHAQRYNPSDRLI